MYGKICFPIFEPPNSIFMENTTKSKSENENYWGYIIFSAIALICTLNSGNIYQWVASDKAINNSKTNQNTEIHKSKEKKYTCSICGRETGPNADQMWKGKCYMCYEFSKKIK